MKRFQNKTVVITGASSGLGRATAKAFAREGAQLGLIARNEDALIQLAQEVIELGGKAIVFPLDVTDEPEVRRAAYDVARVFGGIDVWLNNAGVAVYGDADKVPIDEMRRVVDVNLFGQVIGARAALPYLEDARGGGVLIGTLSVLSEASTPLMSSYVASKHAILGFYKSLREELIHRHSRVKIAGIFAPGMATPLFDHARTYLGYLPKPYRPIYPPEDYAQLMVETALHPRFRVVHGAFSRVALSMFHHVPEFGHWFQGKTGYWAQRTKTPKALTDGDNLFNPLRTGYTVRGTVPVTPYWSLIENWISPVYNAARWGLGVYAVIQTIQSLRRQTHVRTLQTSDQKHKSAA